MVHQPLHLLFWYLFYVHDWSSCHPVVTIDDDPYLHKQRKPPQSLAVINRPITLNLPCLLQSIDDQSTKPSRN